jgi:hypothetical protein
MARFVREASHRLNLSPTGSLKLMKFLPQAVQGIAPFRSSAKHLRSYSGFLNRDWSSSAMMRPAIELADGLPGGCIVRLRYIPVDKEFRLLQTRRNQG